MIALAVIFVMSGSSTVYVRGKSFSVSLESVRKIFRHDLADPNQEQEWHERWRKDHQPIVDAAAKTIERVIFEHTHKHPLPLATYVEAPREVWAWSEPDEEHSYDNAKRRNGALRYVVRFDRREKSPPTLKDLQLEIAFSTLPSLDKIDALIVAIEARFAAE